MAKTKAQKLKDLQNKLIDARYDYERVYGDKESLSKVKKIEKKIKATLK